MICKFYLFIMIFQNCSLIFLLKKYKISRFYVNILRISLVMLFITFVVSCGKSSDSYHNVDNPEDGSTLGNFGSNYEDGFRIDDSLRAKRDAEETMEPPFEKLETFMNTDKEVRINTNGAKTNESVIVRFSFKEIENSYLKNNLVIWNQLEVNKNEELEVQPLWNLLKKYTFPSKGMLEKVKEDFLTQIKRKMKTCYLNGYNSIDFTYGEALDWCKKIDRYSKLFDTQKIEMQRKNSNYEVQERGITDFLNKVKKACNNAFGHDSEEMLIDIHSISGPKSCHKIEGELKIYKSVSNYLESPGATDECSVPVIICEDGDTITINVNSQKENLGSGIGGRSNLSEYMEVRDSHNDNYKPVVNGWGNTVYVSKGAVNGTVNNGMNSPSNNYKSGVNGWGNTVYPSKLGINGNLNESINSPTNNYKSGVNGWGNTVYSSKGGKSGVFI